jgi:hypothetical protein
MYKFNLNMLLKLAKLNLKDDVPVHKKLSAAKQ